VGIWNLPDYKELYNFIWFRAHYDSAQDEKWEEIVTVAGTEHEKEQLLNHPDFAHIIRGSDISPSFEEACVRLLLVVPEIVRRRGHSDFFPGDTIDYVSNYRDNLDGSTYLDKLRGDLRAEVLARVDPRDRQGWVDYSTTTKHVQMLMCEYSVIIVDADSFTTQMVTMLLLDWQGNVVRWMRLDADGDISAASSPNFWLVLPEYEGDEELMGENENAGVGPKYRPRAEIGKQLYGVDDLLEGIEPNKE
jgi:hypothetical protein